MSPTARAGVGILTRIACGAFVCASIAAISRRADSAESVPAVKEPIWTSEQRSHWSFIPPVRPEVPRVQDRAWVRNPIDAFILSDLESVDLTPAAEADRRTLIRRVTFDLTGLPPTPAEVDAFLADCRVDAYERLVDRLLASPRYGERWARFWLDLARYAESDGFKSDLPRPNAWRYRDWVIEAFNQDMPYDRFVQLQLAGDEIAPGDHKAFIATGFNRNWPYEDNNKFPGLNRQLILDDMTDTTGAVFLGLTIACARCHDHKFDAISQKDYYRFEAMFAGAEAKDDYSIASPEEKAMHASVSAETEARLSLVRRAVDSIERTYKLKLLKDKLAKLPADVRKALETDPEERSAFQEDLLAKNANMMTIEPKAIAAAMTDSDRKLWTERRREMESVRKEAPAQLPTAIGMTEPGGEPAAVHLLFKGNLLNPGEAVAPGFLSVLCSGSPDLNTCECDKNKQEKSASAESERKSSGRRRALAEWLTRDDNPLTARVIVNRLWQNHFGRGIVATASDFGTQGAEPTNPELLDWLATELVARGYRLKAMHRLMVTSSTYRQSSLGSPKTIKEDPDNTLFGRMNRRRIEAEAVRDAILAVSGEIDLRIGGPSVYPELPAGINPRGGWKASPSEADRNRRSIYVFVKRNLKLPLFDAFDSPDTNVTCPERLTSVNAPQALTLLNSDWTFERARALANRVLNERGASITDQDFIETVYEYTFSRKPNSVELERAIAFLKRDRELYERESKKSVDDRVPAAVDRSRAAALADLCHAMINLNEFVFVD